jgi:catechol 2,3-dioxygenase-like lactoylglutathione lyase family enzyme
VSSLRTRAGGRLLDLAPRRVLACSDPLGRYARAEVFDHVTVRVSEVEQARRFYETALAIIEFGEPDRGGHFFEWRDLSIAQSRDDRPVTRHLHLGLVAPSRERVDEFWGTLTEQGYRDDGAPGPREKYRPGYYGGFVLDPDRSSFLVIR